TTPDVCGLSLAPRTTLVAASPTRPASSVRISHSPGWTMTIIPTARCRPSVEALEERVVPATTYPTPLTPVQVRQIYGFNQVSFANGVRADGSGQTIAIVDAFDDPNIVKDLDTFDKTFSLGGNGFPGAGNPSIYSQYGAASSFLTKYSQPGITTDPS